MNEDKRKYNKVAFIVCACFLVAAVITGGISVVCTMKQKSVEGQLEQLTENIVPNAEPEDSCIEEIVFTESLSDEFEVDPLEKLKEMEIPILEKAIDFEELQTNVNEDIYAWIYIPNSKIDYPVVQHPEDNNYYLNYNLDGSKGYPGCIYTENYNAKEFTDPNTVIYGHNMKDGSMFAGLHKYEDIEYFDANRYIYIYTPDELLVYEIFAAYEASNEHILYNHDFNNETVYSVYLDEVFTSHSMVCNLREEVEVTTEDRIITLSTCIANKPDNRYLVQGVLLNE